MMPAGHHSDSDATLLPLPKSAITWFVKKCLLGCWTISWILYVGSLTVDMSKKILTKRVVVLQKEEYIVVMESFRCLSLAAAEIWRVVSSIHYIV